MRNAKANSRYASARKIREIIGPFEDEVIARILELEPSVDDVRQAYAWLRSDEYYMRNLAPSVGGKAREVFEIFDDLLPPRPNASLLARSDRQLFAPAIESSPAGRWVTGEHARG
ncbi:hypothetical protein [Cupriavidus necator]